MTGWRGSACDSLAHRRLIAGRCADCGKRPMSDRRRVELAARAWAASIIHWEQPA